MKRTTLEAEIQRRIEVAIGAEPDFLLFRNSVGKARHVSRDGVEFYVPYGLGNGSPDLVGILAPSGTWVALEIKRPGEEATDEQKQVHAVWRRFGAFVGVVTSPDEARSALNDARQYASEQRSAASGK